MRVVFLLMLVFISGCVFQSHSIPPPIQQRLEDTVTKTCVGFKDFAYREHQLSADGNLTLVLTATESLEVSNITVNGKTGTTNTPFSVSPGQTFTTQFRDSSLVGTPGDKYSVQVTIDFKTRFEHQDSASCSGVYE